MPYDDNSEGLLAFLRAKIIPDHNNTEEILEQRPLIRKQMAGESLDPEKHEPLAKYEYHLDRKLEKTLALLMKIQITRQHVEA